MHHRVLIWISPKFPLKGPLDDVASGQVMTWRRAIDRPLPVPMMTQFTDAYVGTPGPNVLNRRQRPEIQTTFLRNHCRSFNDGPSKFLKRAQRITHSRSIIVVYEIYHFIVWIYVSWCSLALKNWATGNSRVIGGSLYKGPIMRRVCAFMPWQHHNTKTKTL